MTSYDIRLNPILVTMRIVLAVLGLLALVEAAWGKGFNRWGLYEFDDESDIVLDRRTARLLAAVIGIALIVWAVLCDEPGWGWD